MRFFIMFRHTRQRPFSVFCPLQNDFEYRLDFYNISSLSHYFSEAPCCLRNCETVERNIWKLISEGYGATETCGGVTMPT